MDGINKFFAALDQSFFAFTLGVLVFQTVYVSTQLILTRRAEFLWYVFYLIFALIICLIINVDEQGYRASIEKSSWGMIFSLSSFLCYWLFWKTLFNVKSRDGFINHLINAVILVFGLLILETGLAMITPSFQPIYYVSFQALSILIQIASVVLFYFTYKTRDKILASLMIAGALFANFLMMFPQMIFAGTFSGLPAREGMSFLLLSYDVETIFLSIALAYHTRQVFQTNKNLNMRIAEIKMAALRAQMNPHFIYNTLNAVNRFLLNNENEAASHYFTKFARLIRLILHHSRMDVVLLKDEIHALNLYLEMESLRFRDRFEYTFNISPEVDEEEQVIPPLLIQPIVENAIYHGLLPKKGQRSLNIQIDVIDSSLNITITDNGIGRKEAAKKKPTNIIKEKSYGIQIIKERLTALTELSGLKTQFQIIDLVNDAQEPLGTQVCLTIPLKKPFL